MIDFTLLTCLSHILLNSESLHKRSWWRQVMVYVFLLTGTVRGVQGKDCGGQLTDSFGVIMTEGYPSRTASLEETCTWTIRVDVTKKIKLKFKDFDLAPPTNDSCSESYASVTRENDGVATGTFCGSEIPPVINVTGEAMVVTFFTTGKYNDHRGFYAEYTTPGVSIKTAEYHYVQPPETSVSLQIPCGNEYPYGKISTSLYRADVPGKSSKFTLVAESRMDVDNGTVKIFVDADRVSVLGDSRTFLAVTFHSATCNDSGIYKCVYRYNEFDIDFDEEIIRIVYVTLALTPVQNTLAPSVPCREVGSKVNLTCTLLMGPLYPGIKRDVIFENSLSGDTMLWKKISGEFTQSKSEEVPSDECQLKYESILIKEVTDSDYGSLYRCTVEESGAFSEMYNTERHPSSTFHIQPSVALKRPDSLSLTYQIKKAENNQYNKLIITCQSNTGIPRSGLATVWHWEYRLYGSREKWMEHKVHDHESNYSIDDNCQVSQASTVVIALAPEENDREIRCYFTWNFSDGSTESFEHLAATYHNTKIEASEKEESPENKYDMLVFGSLMGMGIFVFLLGLLIWYFCYYRRTSQEPAASEIHRVPEPFPMEKTEIADVRKTDITKDDNALVTALVTLPKAEDRRYSSSVDVLIERRCSTSV